MEFQNNVIKNIYFVISKAVLPLDLGGPLQVFLEAQRAGAPIALHYVSPTSEQVLGGGLTLANLSPLPQTLLCHDVVVLPGSYGSFDYCLSEEGEVVADWLKHSVRQQLVFTICSGAFMAAKAGLLANKKCTTHHELTERLKLAYPELNVLETCLFVEDGNMLTSAGISSGIDAALHFVAKQFGDELSMKVAREMLVYFRRDGRDSQQSVWLNGRNHLHRAVHRAQDLICARLHQDIRVASIASDVGISERQLSRLFKQAIGIGVQQYINSLKIVRAKQLLQTRHIDIELVATECGFSSSRHFRRIWQQFETIAPSQFRKSIMS
ncbi:GlxA family transcriptional regulator [Pseudoalteromonas xiamenensis]